MQPNNAQTLIISFVGETGRDPMHGYKAPHAMRGTPARPQYKRKPRLVFSKAHDEMIAVRRPFKGYRA